MHKTLCFLCYLILFAACNNNISDPFKISLAELGQEVISCWKSKKNVHEYNKNLSAASEQALRAQCSKEDMKKAKQDLICQLNECKLVEDFNDCIKNSVAKCPDLGISSNCLKTLFSPAL